MTLSELGSSEVSKLLSRGDLVVRTGPFNFRIQSDIDSVAAGLNLLYADFPIVNTGDFVDFTVHLQRTGGLRRVWRPQVRFVYDGTSPFLPLPLIQAFPLLEWSMNWCISTQAHQFLLLHSAVIERDGCAVIMPAPPGSGKSTLCAGLISRGWRLLSDELALISLSDGALFPLCRPVSLKNQSIEIIQRYRPGAIFNEVTHDTGKGSVTHMKVSASDIARINETVAPSCVIFPKFRSGANAKLTQRSKAASLLELGRNSFNYMVLGLKGYEVLADLIDTSNCYDFEYAHLDDAVAVFDGLIQNE